MVYVMLAEGFEEIEALTVVDILRRANIDVKTVSVSGDHIVEGAHNIRIGTDILFDDISEEPDMIILPGGMPGTKNLDADDRLRNLLIHSYENNKYVAAICAAPMILGKLGFLKGKIATCYPSFETYLEGATLSRDKVCVDDNVITSRGPGTASDFALCIVELLKDNDIREKLHGDMIYE